MNYILEMKAFYELLELNQLHTPAIVLWHALMHMANKTGWQDNFTVAIQVLTIKTGLNKQAVLKARNELKDKGLIDFKTKNNQAASYSMKSLLQYKNERENHTAKDTASDTANDTAEDTASDTANDTAEDTINKHKQNETKQNETNKKDNSNFCTEPEQAASMPEPIIALPLNDKTLHPVFQKDIDELKELYPAVDVIQELRNMRGWLLANPERAKTKRGIRRFINGWLIREQDRGKSIRTPAEITMHPASQGLNKQELERRRKWLEE